jgi:exodeoxyribonuclease-3
VLLRWLGEARARRGLSFRELKAPQEKFPEAAIRSGFGAVWQGKRAGTASHTGARRRSGRDPARPPGDPTTSRGRYIERPSAGCWSAALYLPNGNPAPGPKFDYKLRWFERLTAHAAELLATGEPVVLAAIST